MAQLDPRAFDSRIDFSPIMNALDGYQRGMKESRAYEGNQKVGGALANKDYETALAMAGQYGMEPSMLMQLGEKYRQEQERQRAAAALQNPELTKGMPAPYMAAIRTLSPEQQAAQLAQAHSPVTAAQLASSRMSTALHGQQLQTAQATAPYDIDLKRLQAANAQREFDAPKDNLQKLKDDETLYRVNPRTGAVEQIAGQTQGVGISKDYRKAYDKEMGEAQAKATIDLPRIQDNATLALKTIEDIRSHPGRSTGTGVIGMVAPYAPSSDARGFANLVDQAKGKTFLEAFNSLRGGGQITEAEGNKATQALARLDRAQGQRDFDLALKDLEDVIKIGTARAERMARGQYSTPAQRQPVQQQPAAPKAPPPPNPQAIDMLRANPALAPQFDEIFGQGAARRVLGGQ